MKSDMHLRALYLQNFRVYEEALFEFSPQINVIRGPNARGKTSLLEAIYLLITGRSFRTTQASDLIRHGAYSFFLDASFIKHGIEQKLRIQYDGKERKVFYNSTLCPSSSLLGLLQGALIHPDDAAIIKGPPAVRRHLLDLQLGQIDPLYVHYLTRYERAMRQRNHLLRAKSQVGIESWEQEMSNAASYIIPQRAKTVNRLQETGKKLYSHLCNTEELGLLYKPCGAAGQEITAENNPLRSLFCDQYRRHRPREMELGLTLTGPHKDDISLILNNKEVRAFASEGQQRSCVAALRLAEWESLKTQSLEQPLMLVDDLGISLDASRRKQMLSHFSTLSQVFLTTTEEQKLINGEHTIAV